MYPRWDQVTLVRRAFIGIDIALFQPHDISLKKWAAKEIVQNICRGSSFITTSDLNQRNLPALVDMVSRFHLVDFTGSFTIHNDQILSLQNQLTNKTNTALSFRVAEKKWFEIVSSSHFSIIAFIVSVYFKTGFGYINIGSEKSSLSFYRNFRHLNFGHSIFLKVDASDKLSFLMYFKYFKTHNLLGRKNYKHDMLTKAATL